MSRFQMSWIDGSSPITGKVNERLLFCTVESFCDMRDDVTAQRHVVAQQFDVVVGEAHLHSGLVASGLLRSAAGKNADRGRAEALEDMSRSPCRSRCRRRAAARPWRCPTPCPAMVSRVGADRGAWPSTPVVRDRGACLFLAQGLHGFQQRGAARRIKPSQPLPPLASESTASAAVGGTSFGGSNPWPRSTPESAPSAPPRLQCRCRRSAASETRLPRRTGT